MFSGRRGRNLSGPKAKKAKTTTYDRDVVCLPNSYPSQVGRYVIPRRETRADLASKGLIGKLRLVSDMTEEDIMEEIRSVFAAPMGNDANFPFVFLQRCGPGSNALTAPSVSASFSWTAKEVVRLAGQGCLYIRAESDLVIVKPEPGPKVSNKYSCTVTVGVKHEGRIIIGSNLLHWCLVQYSYYTHVCCIK
jgi:hypothetical protein